MRYAEVLQLLQQLERAGKHLPGAAAHEGNFAALLGGDNHDGVGAFGDPHGGAVACAELLRHVGAVRQGQNHVHPRDTPGFDQHRAIVHG